MIVVRHERLFNEFNEIVHFTKAIKGNQYKKYPNAPLDYIFRAGDKNIHHFSLKSEGFNPFAAISNNSSKQESDEHYNAKMEIADNKKYFDTIFNQWIEFDNVIPEFWHEIKKRPDLSCYDSKNNLVCCIEICWSNAKTEIDIEKLKKLKVPIIEIDVKNDNRCKHIVLTEVLEFNRGKFNLIEQEKFRLEKTYRGFSTEAGTEYSRISFEIAKFEGETETYIKAKISTIADWLQKRSPEDITKQRGFFKAKLSKQNRSNFNLEEIADWIQKRLGRITTESNVAESIKEVKNRITKSKLNNEKIDYGIGKLEKEVARIELSITERRKSFNEIASKSKIEWFRNSWMTYKPQNLIQEIKYWLC